MGRKIAVVTGSRADYGLLYWILHDLQTDPEIELQLIVTGMHLAPEFGSTVSEIERDGFPIVRRVEMLLSGDSPGAVAKSLGLGVIGFSDALDQLRPDLLLVLGDRFEILAAVQAAMIHNVPIAHIAGGDTTEGAFDEGIRHAITKMSHLHLVTTASAAQRVRQMGESPAHVHVVGSPGLDHLRRRPLLERSALEPALGAPLGERNLLITFHPVTLEPGEGLRQQEELMRAVERLPADITCWFTLPNADTGGRGLAQALTSWAKDRPSTHVHASLGQLRYLSLMNHVDMVVGNSSSGLYEAPSFAIPTVNIGNRQRGRLAAPSVLHCEPTAADISAALAKAWTLDCSDVVNPYGDGHSSARIIEALKRLPDAPVLLKKAFHPFEQGDS
jgi:UDP-N-acetylglucosamine 2-epimerase (non-hydrolysing)/GDP/UDP-N,N'-diacetylbacillosamine 2-epimerase (hydrolysing)